MNKITTKAAKRLYLLKQLKKSELDTNDLECFYVALIRTTLEHACQVFHYGLPHYVSEAIERIQKRAFRNIYPDVSYPQINSTWLPCGREKRNCVLNSKMWNEAVT